MNKETDGLFTAETPPLFLGVILLGQNPWAYYVSLQSHGTTASNTLLIPSEKLLANQNLNYSTKAKI